jgi:hypothetical protein
LELYRLRWQIEMTFKRPKGLLDLGHVPAKDPQLAQSYLFAKLLAALLLENLTRDFLAFPPSEALRSAKTRQSVENPADPARSAGLRGAGPSKPRRPDPESLRVGAPCL